MPNDVIQCFHCVGICFWTEPRRKNSVQPGSTRGRSRWSLDEIVQPTPPWHLFLPPAQPCGPSGMDSDEITRFDFPSSTNCAPPPTSPTMSCSSFGHIEDRQELGTRGSWGLLSKDGQARALRMTHPTQTISLHHSLILERKKKNQTVVRIFLSLSVVCACPGGKLGGHPGFSKQQRNLALLVTDGIWLGKQRAQHSGETRRNK